MSRKYKFHDLSKLYFITFTVVNWVDVFTRPAYKDILIESWKYCHGKKGLDIYGWVIMTNHVHMIIGSHGVDLNLIIGQMKRFTSISLKKEIYYNQWESRREWMLKIFTEAGKLRSNTDEWQFWQHESHPIKLFSDKIFQQKLNYIHNNPVKAGWVKRGEDYVYSSAIDYCGGKGLVELA